MSRKKLGQNKYQKRAFRIGEARINGGNIGKLIGLSRSNDPKDRETAARFLCPCHIRRRREDVWQALYRMLEDPDLRVRKAAWHTLEDGGRPDDPALGVIFERAVEKDTDKGIRRQAAAYLKARGAPAESALQADARTGRRGRGKCDFCGSTDVFVKTDFGIEIPDGDQMRFGLACECCAG
ncbi:MAG: HEAT repeat domain-containing protein [Gemmatimonadota bacterium]|nr:HEAT repeat domain-containing protein [Gemmatimonadota bacterium]